MQRALNYIHNELKELFSENEIRQISYLLISKITKLSRTEIFVNKNRYFSDNEQQKLMNFVQQLRLQVPIQYVLGETEFLGIKINVDCSVLIPRPETEELIEWILDQYKNKKQPQRILDIGTGSGCIALALKKYFPQANVVGFDISEKALDKAKDNGRESRLEVDFRKVDILQQPQFTEKWDLIVSNPPYIPEKEKIEMHPNVLNYEPHEALFVSNDDPLLFYRNIALFAVNHLEKNGCLFFEINRSYGTEVLTLLGKIGFKNLDLRKDISENDRMVKTTF